MAHVNLPFSRSLPFARSLPFVRLLLSAFLLTLLTGAIGSAPALAQKGGSSNDETLFGAVRLSGGYGAPTVALTSAHGEAAVLAEGQGGWIINRRFVIGGAARGLATLPEADLVTVPEREPPSVQLGYGGLLFEYIGAPSKLVHYGAELVIGGGSVQLVEEDYEPREDESLARSGVFAGELGARLEVNLTSFFRLGLSGGYRLVSGVDVQGTSDADLSAPYGQLSLRFGSF